MNFNTIFYVHVRARKLHRDIIRCLTRDGLFLFKINFLLSISFVEFLRRENLKFEAYEIKKFRNFASFKREFFFFFW